MLVELASPVVIAGDIHGRYWSVGLLYPNEVMCSSTAFTRFQVNSRTFYGISTGYVMGSPNARTANMLYNKFSRRLGGISRPKKLLVYGRLCRSVSAFSLSNYDATFSILVNVSIFGSGKRSLETICLVLAYKIKFPENFFLLAVTTNARASTVFMDFTTNVSLACRHKTYFLGNCSESRKR